MKTFIRKLYASLDPDIRRLVSNCELNSMGAGTYRCLTDKLSMTSTLIFTPLIQAILLRMSNLVDLLIRLGVDCNKPFECEYPYTYAIFSLITAQTSEDEEESVTIINLLLSQNLKFTDKNANHPKCSLIGCRQALYFVDHLPIDNDMILMNEDGSPLHVLAQSMYKRFTVLGKSLPYDWTEDDFEYLFDTLTKDYSVDINFKDKNGFTAYYLALRDNNDIVVRALIKAGADITLPSFVRRRSNYEAALLAREQTYIL